ncbi:hypothetical protein [Nitrosomonas marina]|nr:hypothetical protein [Nitrosomonas marina]
MKSFTCIKYFDLSTFAANNAFAIQESLTRTADDVIEITTDISAIFAPI